MADKVFARIDGKSYATRAEFRAERQRLQRQVAEGKRGAKKLARMQAYEYRRRQHIGKTKGKSRLAAAGHYKAETTPPTQLNFYGKETEGQETFVDHSTRGRVTVVTAREWAEIKAAIAKEAKLHPYGKSWLRVEGSKPIVSPPGTENTTSWVSTFAILTSALAKMVKDMTLTEMLDADISGPPLSSYHFEKIIGLAFTHTTENVV